MLFFDFSKYIKSLDDKDFILVYSYPLRIRDKDEINNIKEFSKRSNKKLISIGSFYDWCDDMVSPHPFEVLSYFISADYIITDTFHGTLLSLKYNKQFITIIRNSNQTKLRHLLHFMNLAHLYLYENL
ncbi:hypothetical protein AGMMS50267_13040 [Spirochaetia bacterium]|nr:hypothetical protein AGMMS50267_13040 [Spirochaetia bacterium]